MNHIEAVNILFGLIGDRPSICGDDRRALCCAIRVLLDVTFDTHTEQPPTRVTPCSCQPAYPHLVLEPVDGITTAAELRTGYVFSRDGETVTRIRGVHRDGQLSISWIDGLQDYGTLDPSARVHSVHRIVRAEL